MDSAQLAGQGNDTHIHTFIQNMLLTPESRLQKLYEHREMTLLSMDSAFAIHSQPEVRTTLKLHLCFNFHNIIKETAVSSYTVITYECNTWVEAELCISHYLVHTHSTLLKFMYRLLRDFF